MKINGESFLLIAYFIAISSQFSNNCGIEAESSEQRYVIAVFLPVHTGGNNFKCYDKIEDSPYRNAPQTLEALHFSLDMINKDDKILPNTTLELVVEDFCYLSDLGTVEMMKLVETSLCWINEVRNTNLLSCPSNDSKSFLVGVILPKDSDSFPNLENFLRSLNIPQISYGAPQTGILDDIEIKTSHSSGSVSSVYSISSGNMFMTDVIFEILAHFNWTYVALVHSAVTVTNIDVVKRFTKLAASYGVCIADVIDTLQITQSWFEGAPKINLWNIMPSFDTVDVIICYCDERERKDLYNSIKGYGRNRREKSFVVITGDQRPGEPETTRRLDPTIGEIFISMRRQQVKEFDDYYLSRTVQNNQRNPWFKEYWQQNFQCKFEPENEKEKKCTGDEKFERYKQYVDVPNIITSVHVLAHGLHDTLTRNSTYTSFDAFRNSMGISIQNINFTLFDDEISFDLNKLPTVVKYDIYNAQKINKSLGYVKVGEYVKSGNMYYERKSALLARHGTLRIKGKLSMNDVFLPLTVRTSCSEPCPTGYATIKRNDSCCWDCDPCNSLEILINSTLCTKCEHGFMSNAARTKCLPIPCKDPKWHNIENLISAFFSLLAIILTLFISGVFIKYRNTPAVKSSTKELCYIMFVGMIIANITPFISILPIDAFNCGMIRIIPAISFTVIFAALLVKTNRIARLLAMSKKKFPNMNPRFMSLRSQITITFILIVIEIMICSLSLYFHLPRAIIDYKEEKNTWIGSKSCHLDRDILTETFTFVVVLIILCTHYAVKTRNLPENFNEAKCIGLAMYATLLTGTAFGLVYFSSARKILSVNMCVSIISLVILIFIFTPKLYIILWRPKRNTRANFTTTSSVRSYLGNAQRSNSRRQGSQQYSLEGKEQKYSSKVSKERIVNSITDVDNILTDVINLLNTDDVVEKLENRNENQRAEIEKLKSCRNELNNMKKEFTRE